MDALFLLDANFFENFGNRVFRNFIKDDRYIYILKGLGNTLKITLFAVLLGIFLGFLIAMVRSTYDINKNSKNKSSFLGILNFICNLYLTVIRGTPAMVQLLILYYIVFSSINNKIMVAILAFGINSGAYVAEIFRAGIMSIDKGQMEAGRSLGFNFFQSMIYVIMPQAFKNVLPALGNEIIVLVKETAICGYIAIQDLTKGGDIIRSLTYDAYMPLLTVAIIYLILTSIMTYFVNKLERRLRSSDH
ncbi:MAG: amino acid ABC transporter permease [Lachnospiraceae bacterium]|nr:amino acid ABC transporter permease [Lachnospiraceae bacterium]